MKAVSSLNFSFLAILVGLILVASNANAKAPSFDCAKASSQVEKMICASPQLSELDSEMAAAYKDALFHASSGTNKALRAEQQTWIKSRNHCTTASCLTDSYNHRIQRLKPANDYAKGTSAAPAVSDKIDAASEASMKSECKGAAAGQYGTKPVYVTLSQVWPASDGFSIEGSVDQGSNGKKNFNCIFDTHRKLKDVMALTSDGE